MARVPLLVPCRRGGPSAGARERATPVANPALVRVAPLRESADVGIRNSGPAVAGACPAHPLPPVPASGRAAGGTGGGNLGGVCDCRFTGGITAHCSACHRTFTGVKSFDRHQRLTGGGRVCLDPAGLTRRDGTPLMQADRRGYWQLTRDDARPAHWHRAA